MDEEQVDELDVVVSRCQATTLIGRYEDEEIQCCLPLGHDGPHVNNEGTNTVASFCMWNDATTKE